METVSIAQVRRVSGNRRWDEKVEMAGSMAELRDSVAAEAERNNWRVVGFVPVQYGMQNQPRRVIE